MGDCTRPLWEQLRATLDEKLKATRVVMCDARGVTDGRQMG
jgi:hypothetical protein